MMLTEHLVRCETGSVDINTCWYKNCVERLQQIFLMVHLISHMAHIYKSTKCSRYCINHLFSTHCVWQLHLVVATHEG